MRGKDVCKEGREKKKSVSQKFNPQPVAYKKKIYFGYVVSSWSVFSGLGPIGSMTVTYLKPFVG